MLAATRRPPKESPVKKVPFRRGYQKGYQIEPEMTVILPSSQARIPAADALNPRECDILPEFGFWMRRMGFRGSRVQIPPSRFA